MGRKQQRQQHQQVSSSERIMQCVRELVAGGQLATRETICRLSNLPRSVVDDRLRFLVDGERLRRTQRGIYELVKAYPQTRVMSKTIMGDGFVKVEIGDEMLTLTPTEDRHLALLQAGAAGAVQAAGAASVQQAMLSEALSAITSLSREVRTLRACVARSQKHALGFAQMELELEDTEHGNEGKETDAKASARQQKARAD